MKKVTLFRVVKQSMFFCEDDFESVKEYDKFVDELKSNKDFLLDTFYDNCDGSNEEIISNVEIVKGLIMNGINEKNIELFLKLKDVAEELGFEFSEYDGMDDLFYVTFKIKNEFK